MTTADDGYQRPILTVDIVLLTMDENGLNVAVLERAAEPYKGQNALIGGYVHVDVDKDDHAAVERVLLTKTGLSGIYFEQLKTFAGATRDPRGWSSSIAFIALAPIELIRSASKTYPITIHPVDEIKGLAFDHDEILDFAIRRLRGKGAYSTLPAQLLGEKFTLPKLHEVYSKVMGVDLDMSSFRRKIADLDLIEETDEFEEPLPRRRPGKLYRLKHGVTTFDRSI